MMFSYGTGPNMPSGDVYLVEQLHPYIQFCLGSSQRSSMLFDNGAIKRALHCSPLWAICIIE